MEKRTVVELIRLEECFEYGTFGILKIDKRIFCVTLEPPDHLNERNVSSIPAQQYICRPYSSGRFGKTFMVVNVPGRNYILFHAGNLVAQTKGCIILGQYFGKLKGDRAVLNSGATFKEFMRHMAGVDEFHLTVKEVY